MGLVSTHVSFIWLEDRADAVSDVGVAKAEVQKGAGEIAKALMGKADELLAKAPSIEMIDVLAVK